MPNKRPYKNLYWPEERNKQAQELMQRMEDEGYDLRDIRGNLSLSETVRILIEERLHQLTD